MTRRPRPFTFDIFWSAPRRGFTLIEMLIVIGVILLLTAITVTVITGLTARSEIRDTENTMRLMDQALSEWELAMGRQVTFGLDDEPCDNNEKYEIDQVVNAGFTWGDDDDAMTAALERSDILWSLLSRNSSSREIIARINPHFMQELDPQNDPNNEYDHLDGRLGYRFLDAWDNPIIAVMPGRRYQRAAGGCPEDTVYCVGNLTAPCPDDDGTIRTPYENRFGVAASRRIFFVSAGPSGRFGDLHLHVSRQSLNNNHKEGIARAADNVYSGEVVFEDGRPQ